MLSNTLNKKENKIRIALVGCGRISKNHLKSIAIFSNLCTLVGICDKNRDNLENAYSLAGELFSKNDFLKIKKFDDFTNLITSSKNNSNKIDLVVLCTPSGLHSKQTIEASEAGINVCTEKPMATNLKDGIEMIKSCEKNRVRLFEIKQNRFSKTMQLLKKQIDKGRFGKISIVSINVFWQRPQSYYDQENWRGTKDFDGGVLMNQANHYTDLLTWLFGPVDKICSFMSTIGREIEVEDTATLQIKWKKGFLGTMSVTMLTYPNNFEASITVLGEKGTVRIGGKGVNIIEHWEFLENSLDDTEIQEASNKTTKEQGFGHPNYYANMLNILLNKNDSEINNRDSFAGLELLVAAYQSAEKNMTINLPLYNFD